MSGNKITKSPITYWGGKTSIINHILELVPPHETFTEPYFGGGEVFWCKDPVKNETINDRLDIVVNFYEVLKLRFKPLKKLIDATLISRTIHNRANTIIRSHKRGYKIDRVKLAWAFWVSSNFSVMHKLTGGYKQQKNGGRSYPGTLQNKKMDFTDRLVARIENATIENTDAIRVLNARNHPNALHYLDPIYPDTNEETYRFFGHAKTTWADYETLLKWLATCKGKFILSSYNNEVLHGYQAIYGWNKKEITHKLKAPRQGGKQLTKTEVLVYNYTPHGTLSLFN